MINLPSSNRSLVVTTGNSNSLDWSASWVDVTGSVTYTPGGDVGNVASPTDTEIVPAPVDGTNRGVKGLSFTNLGGSAQTLTVKINKSGTKRAITPAKSIAAGETLYWSEATGWVEIGT